MNPRRWIGHVLMWLGFFAGAFVTVQNVEVEADKWSTIHWPYYVLALSVGVAGVVMLRITARHVSTHKDKLQSDIQTLEVSMRELLEKLGDLHKHKNSTSVFHVHRLIDERLLDNIDAFVQARQTVVHTYGLQTYLQIMTDFSLAERYINRAWSASADGYIDEVWASLGHAQEKLEAVARYLQEAKQTLRNDIE
ncbi:MAG: hypothetical protein ACYC0X_24040 [Pirellulaceae bacterium]